MGHVLEVSDVLTVEVQQMLERLYQEMVENDGLNDPDTPVTDPAHEIQFFIMENRHVVSTLFGPLSPELKLVLNAQHWVKKNAAAFNFTHPAPPAE